MTTPTTVKNPAKAPRGRSKRVMSKVGKTAGLSAAQGRPAHVSAILTDKSQRDEVGKMIIAGMSNRNISHALGVNGKMMTEWLNRGDADLEAEMRTPGMIRTDYARFLLWVENLRNMGRQAALQYLQNNDDWRAQEAWLKRTDTEMEYVDRDRIAGRGETNIQVNTGGQQAIRVDSLDTMRQNYLRIQEQERVSLNPASIEEVDVKEAVEGVIEGEVREVEDDDS